MANSRRWLLTLACLPLFCACATQPPPAPPEAEPPVSAPTSEATSIPAPTKPPLQPAGEPDRHISIAAVGDVMLGTDFPENHLPDDDGVGFLADVTPWLAAADITIGNLEGVLLARTRRPVTCSAHRRVTPGICVTPVST